MGAIGLRIRLFALGAPHCEHSIPVIRDYCHSIAAAWEIVEHIEQNIVIDRWERKVEHEQKDWRVMIRVTPYGPQIEAYADTAPMAIVLAFLNLP